MTRSGSTNDQGYKDISLQDIFHFSMLNNKNDNIHKNEVQQIR